MVIFFFLKQNPLLFNTVCIWGKELISSTSYGIVRRRVMTGLEEEGTSLRNGCSSPSFFGFFLWEDGENIFTCTKHHSRCVIFHLGGRLKYEEKGVREHGVTTELYVHWGVVYAYPVQLVQGYLPVIQKPIITKSPEATFPESVYFNSPRKMHLKASDLELNLQRVETLEAVSSTAAAVALEGWLPGTLLTEQETAQLRNNFWQSQVASSSNSSFLIGSFLPWQRQ